MADEEYISPGLQAILDEFAKIRDAYIALKTYCAVQDETLAIEKEYSEKMKENSDKLLKTYSLLEKRYKSTIEDLETQRKGLRETIEDLKEQCNHLRLINANQSGNEEQMFRLQDEVEVLKANLSLVEEQHNEEVALLKQQHSDEIQRYKVLLQNAKLASTSGEAKKRGRSKNLIKNKHSPYFRWPELNVERVTNTKTEEEMTDTGTRKRRKLFYEDRDAQIDIV